jgi:enoyl-CoA hydratase/carnithine racemase
MPQAQAYEFATDVMARTSQLPDAQEGMRAFLAKRRPQWQRGAD